MKKQIWLALVVGTIVSVGLVYRYFEDVVPFVNVHITMDREAAYEKSYELAQKYNWDVQGYNITASFKDNKELQAFVELEGGGKAAFKDMIMQGYHQPYQWVVRFYKPNTIYEVLVGFKPDGTPYEFSVKIPEDVPGEALSRNHAEQVVEQGVVGWGINLEQYELVEYNSTTQPNGRVDHAFVYQCRDACIGAGLYRLKIKVAGDKLACVDHFVKVPDEFVRRFQNMFADNSLLATMARNVTVFIYIFIIALLLGLYFYRDREYLQIHKYLGIAGIFFSVLALNVMNQWSQIWMMYPTHMSPLLYALMIVGGIVFGLGCFSLVVGVLSMLVDCADRFMFGRHIKFLRVWSDGVGGSYEVFSMTMLGYVSAVLLCGYQVLYGLLAQHLGWWAPLSTLVDPNILSTPVPFWAPISQAFQAGFWEEIVLRGLPIAGVAFLSRHSRYRAWFMVGIFVLQAVLFGALHANYPQMPAYYRLLEMMLPSLWFGGLYYQFGLYPGIVMHCVYDAVLMCIPIWISSFWIQKLGCIICILLPLLIVLAYFVRQKYTLMTAVASSYNHTTRYHAPEITDESFHRKVGQSISKWVLLGMVVFGLLGIGLMWFARVGDFVNPRIEIDGNQAKRIAVQYLADQDITFDNQWLVIPVLRSSGDDIANKFVWQNYSVDEYKRLMQSYLVPMRWVVSFKKFTGSVEERAQQFKVAVTGAGKVVAMQHVFPEQQQGSDLSEKEAVQRAQEYIDQWYHIPSSSLKLMSCESKKHLNRRDYEIVYQDHDGYGLDQGYGKILVRLAGDQLAEIKRSVHVPEEWQRQQQERDAKEDVLRIVPFLLFGLLCLLAARKGLRRYGVSSKLVMLVSLVATVWILLRTLQLWNGWSLVVANFNTAAPLLHQAVQYISSHLIMGIMQGFGLALCAVIVVWQSARCPEKRSILSTIALMFVGCGFAGVELFLLAYANSMQPIDYEYTSFHSAFPALGLLCSYFVGQLLYNVLLIMSAVTIGRYFDEHRHEIFSIVLFMIVGFVFLDMSCVQNLALFIGSGLLMGLLWYFVYRSILLYDFDGVLLICTSFLVCKLAPSIWYGAYPGLHWYAAITVGGLVFFVTWLYQKI